MFRTSIPVFCYHNVSDVDGHTPARFCEHLDAIADAGYRTITSRELLAVTRGQMAAPEKAVVLTFDDGHISNWLNVVPELEKRNMTGTFFCLSDFTVPGEVRTEANMPAYDTMPNAFRAAHMQGDFTQFVNEGEIKAMLNKGMEIFSHGCRHQGTFRTLRPCATMGTNGHWAAWSIYKEFNPDYPTYDVASGYVYDGFWPTFDRGQDPRFVVRNPEDRIAFCREDFRKSFEYFRDLNGYKEQLFCWPWGQFGVDAEAELKKAGYAGAFTLERWVNAEGTDPYRLNRIGVGKKKSGKWVQARLKMYGNAPAARVFFKLQRKRPEVKRVLFATDSEKLSGGSRQMVNNIAALSDMGIKTHAILSPNSPIIGALDGMDVDIIPFDGFRSYFKAGLFLRNIVKDKKIDVVHSFHNRAYKMGVLARLMGAGHKLFINRGVISRPNDIFFLWTALSNGVITNSRQCADVLRKHHVLKSRLNVVYNAYAGPDYGVPQPRKKRGLRVIYIGNAAEIKGFDVFLQAASRFCSSGDYRDCEFIGVGVGEGNMSRFEDSASPIVRERLRLTGNIPHAEVLDEIRHADLLVVPSRKESLPNVLLEGFDFGLPAVCTNVGGIPEIVTDGLNGHLCESEDADCLAAKMRRLAEDPALRYKMGMVGRALVRTVLTPDFKARNLMRVYMGERLDEALPIQEVADTVQIDENIYGQCQH
ncbi:glycosyltransferase [Pseudodesulfovibrio sp. zrk46]|uniref:glycosyltransferase n=1 Tax=Pseudodesulfovibrio sp. zrk46 TaxID=2725288 RepID=UPI00144996E6|nr:glycosyltransferase [Pseudodesulfovibrio sp. zrk46]QJB55840.1 glycosyltransferase [Pseudodesulfovibrio sp. zrk46]